MPHRMIIAAFAAALLAAASTADAQSDPFVWDQPPPEAQLAQDDTVIPLGKGAILVPALTDPSLEPPIILVTPEGVVRDANTGTRVILDPGDYTVIASTSTPGQGVAQPIRVLDGETTIVPVTWGALRIEVTDDKRVPHRGGYELIEATSRQVVGTGFGADTLQGEALLTWLLPPGVYRIVKVGSNYRALKDFATVYVPEGGFVRYRLVTDQETGDFQASGILLPDDFGTPKAQDKPWFRSLILGADGAFAQQNNQVGVSPQSVFSGNLFLDGQFSYRKDEHRVTLLTQIEEGLTQVRPVGSDPLPLVKTRDRLRGDLLYTWFVKERVGPYARASAETQAFSSQLLAITDTDFVRNYADGTVETEPVEAGNTFHLAAAWSPTLMGEGAGLNFRLSTNRWYTLNFRAGLGARQNRWAGAWLLADDPATPAFEYDEVLSKNGVGVETTVIATVKLPGWATYSTDLDLFLDIQSGLPQLEWRNTLTLRLTRNFSLNYFGNIDYLPQARPGQPLGIEQSFLLRASFGLL